MKLFTCTSLPSDPQYANLTSVDASFMTGVPVVRFDALDFGEVLVDGDGDTWERIA